ncbi:MAG: Protein involved in cellulose biosynthesis (CelD)-like protein [Actinomycetia bacterium]|nr:Protein involved in cellulose biosynthesis (CelD)-like protein [Actinomycetes bacterium]
MPHPMGGLRFDIVNDRAGLDELRGPWSALAARAPEQNVFLTWDWAATWWRHFALLDRLHVLVVHDGNDVVAIAPFSRATLGIAGRGFDVLFGLGQEAADYGGFVVGAAGADATRVTAPILDHLLRRVSSGLAVVNLGRLRDDSSTLAVLADATGPVRSADLARDFDEEYPFLDFASLDDAARHVSRLQKRNDVRRRLRRLGEKHEVVFTYREEPAGRALDEFFALHDRRWSDKGAEASGLFVSRHGRAFLRDVAGSLHEHVRISSVRADGQPVAMRFGYEYGDRYYGVKSAFAPEFSAYGPGHLIVGLLLTHLVDSGVQEFDFMRGAGEHKDSWAGATRRVGYWSMARSGRVGAAARWARWQALRARARLRAR